MLALRSTALLLALALLTGAGVAVPAAVGAMDHGDMSAEAPRACCHGMADPCETPCPPDDGRSPVEAAMCCASGDPAPHESAVAPPLPPRLDPEAAPVVDWLLALAAPPAPPRPDSRARHGPPRPPVRSHLAVSVLLI